jgi:regulatory protein
MATVSEIRNHRRGSPRVDVFLDGDYWRAFPRSVLAELPVRVGEEVEPLAIVSDAVALEEAYSRTRVLRLLAYRERCSEELVQRLLDDGVVAEVARATVSDYVASGLIDDVRFAEALARTLLLRGQAPERIARDLNRRGIAPDIAASALEEALGEDGEQEHLERVARRLSRPGDTVDRLAARLARRGFSAGSALRVARRFVEEAEALDER